MRYIDFFKLLYKSFVRSPNLKAKLVVKIFTYIGFFFLLVYMYALVFFAYFYIANEFPNQDSFRILNNYLYIYFFIVFYILMFVQFDRIQVKQFMLLPIKKKKIVSYHLFKVFFHPVSLLLVSMVLLYIAILLFHSYDLIPLTFWGIGVISLLYIIILFMFLTQKNQILQTLTGFFSFIIFIKIKWISEVLKPLGKFFYALSEKYYLSILLFVLLSLLVYGVSKYIIKRFYLDAGLKSKKGKTIKIEISWLDRYGFLGSLIKNDLRLLIRNSRPRQFFIGFFIMYAISFFYLSEPNLKDNYFSLFFIFLLTGFFIFQFGLYIPSWDSEYYPLLMTQNITYQQYLESKWWLMFLSVFVLFIFSLPLIFVNVGVFQKILAFSIYNMGVSIFLVLLLGAFKSTPIKLNKKVKVFQSNEVFNFKEILFTYLITFLPSVIYFFIDEKLGVFYAVLLFTVLGLTGILLRNFILKKIVKLYIRRKYFTISSFSKSEA